MEIFIKFFENMQTELSEAYITSSTTMAIMAGIFAAALIICTAFFMGKNKVLGIIAGIFQIIGVFCTQKMAHIFMQLELFTVIEAGSAAELEEKLMEHLINSILDLIPFMLCSFMLMAGWVMTLVFIIKSMKQTPKILPIFALILHICRYLFITPYPMIDALFAPVTEANMVTTDMLNYAGVILPLILIFIPALIGLIKSKKAPKAE